MEIKMEKTSRIAASSEPKIALKQRRKSTQELCEITYYDNLNIDCHLRWQPICEMNTDRQTDEFPISWKLGSAVGFMLAKKKDIYKGICSSHFEHQVFLLRKQPL